jgi:hypothetical protein
MRLLRIEEAWNRSKYVTKILNSLVDARDKNDVLASHGSKTTVGGCFRTSRELSRKCSPDKSELHNPFQAERRRSWRASFRTGGNVGGAGGSFVTPVATSPTSAAQGGDETPTLEASESVLPAPEEELRMAATLAAVEPEASRWRSRGGLGWPQSTYHCTKTPHAWLFHSPVPTRTHSQWLEI